MCNKADNVEAVHEPADQINDEILLNKWNNYEFVCHKNFCKQR